VTPENESGPKFQFDDSRNLTSSLDQEFLRMPSCSPAMTYDAAAGNLNDKSIVTPENEPDSKFMFDNDSSYRYRNLDQELLRMPPCMAMTYDPGSVDPNDHPIIVVVESKSQLDDRLAQTDQRQ
jgi:hypothetical protein